MMASCAFVAALVVLIAAGLVLEQITFLRPYRSVLLAHYLPWVLAAMAVSFVNVFACCYLVARAVLLKDAGRKLAHLERQLQSGDTLVRDLAARLAAEE